MSSKNVGLSRVLGGRTTAALGLSVASAFTVFVASPVIYARLGQDASGVFVAASLLLLPLVLVLAETAGRMPAGASLYELARAGGRLRFAFSVGWLCLGGYLAMAALLVQMLVGKMSKVAIQVFELELGKLEVTVFVIGIAAIYELIGGSRGGWRTRTLLVLGATGTLLAILLISAHESPSADRPDLSRADIEPWLAGVALLAAGLWALDLILDHRGQVRRARRTVPVGLVFVWIFVNLLGGLTVWVRIRRPELFVTVAEELSPHDQRLILLWVVAAFVLGGGGLLRMVAVFQRLLRRLQIDGLLPAPTQHVRTEQGLLKIPFLVSAGVIFGLALWVPKVSMVAFASQVVLIAATLVALQSARQKDAGSAAGRWLPLHPLFPWVAAVVAIYLAARLVPIVGLYTGLWLGVGVIWLLTAGKKGAIAARERDLVLHAGGEGRQFAVSPVMVAIGGGARAVSLVRSGAAIARQRGRELCVLRVVPFREHVPLEEMQDEAASELRSVEEIVSQASLENVEARSLVRIAPSTEEGILSAVLEQMADFLLMGWSSARGSTTGEEIVEKVFPATSKALGTLHGDPSKGGGRVVVATAGGPHAATALKLGKALSGGDRPLELVTVATPKTDRSPQAVLRETLVDAGVDEDLPTRILQGRDVAEALREELEDEDLLVMGASMDRLLHFTRLDGLSADLAESRGGPTLIVKSREKATHFLRRRLWEPLDRWLPTLSVRERAAVLAQLRHSAKADVDFNVMISLAAFIASLGLLLDSSAVIIGAMLVAPLMSPILALAQGIVQGNASMVRRSAISVAQGTATAILIGTFFGLLFPTEKLTAEMLGRGQPNLLDLLVALAAGAAAAYAVSQSSASAALPGVAISVALVPPLCVVGLGLGMAHFSLALGALLLYFTNLIGIVLVGTGIFLALGFRPTRAKRSATVFRSLRWVVVAILLAAIPLALQTRTTLRKSRLQYRIRQVVPHLNTAEMVLADLRVGEDQQGPTVDIVLVSFAEIEDRQEKVDGLRKRLEDAVGFPLTIRVSLLEGELIESLAGGSENE